MRAAQDAGLIARREPPTHEVLGGQFTAEQSRSLFPKQITCHGKALIAEITQLTLAKPPQFEVKEEHKAGNAKYQAPMTRICATTGDNVGRRLNIQVLTAKEEAGQERQVTTPVTPPPTKPTSPKAPKTLYSASATA